MAIEPYQRKVGIPDAAGGGMTRIADTRSFDIGPAISGLTDTLISTFEPILADEAIKRGTDEAGKVMFTRTEDGKLVLPPRTEDGGRRYAAAFDKVIETRYLNEVGTSFQTTIDQEAADRRTGVKKYDAAEFAASVEATTEGVLSAMDPRIRPQMEEVLRREGLERTRSFTNEWSGNKRRQTIDGVTDQIRFHLNGLAKSQQLGLTQEEALTKHAGPLEGLIGSLEQLGGVGDEQADAILMERDQLTDGIKSYTDGLKKIATILPAISGMGLEDIQRLEYWADGVPFEGDVSGLVRTPVQTPEKVTPDTLRAFAKATFGVDPTSVARPADHPLSIKNPKSFHNTEKGGRAVDIPKIPGMSFEDYVQSYKDAGFTVVEAIDEYKNPSANATGGHWHIALGNTRKVTAEHEISDLKGLTFESVMELDPSVRNQLKQYLTDRRQNIQAEQAQANADRRAQEQTDRLIAAQRETQLSIEGALSQGVGGNWDAKQTALLDRAFSQIDLSKINTDPNVRAQVLGFVQTNNYLPESIFNYLDNSVRSDKWQPAVELYQNLQDATLGQSGARVGDLILSQLDPKTAALLQQSDSLARLGMSRPAIAANLEARRSGNVFTTTEAITEFNRQADNPRENGYQAVKVQMLSDALQTKKGYSLPATLMRDFDVAYTANLEITQQPAKAMQLAINQVKGSYQTTGLFQGNVGPSSLLRSYPRETLTNFMFTEKTTDGNPLIRPVKGQKHRMFGSDPSVRLKPLDSNTKGVGRYSVYVYEPNNTANLIDVFEVDLGAELRDHVQRKNPSANVRTRADLISAARQERKEEVDFWTGFGQRADRIGGKM